MIPYLNIPKEVKYHDEIIISWLQGSIIQMVQEMMLPLNELMLGFLQIDLWPTLTQMHHLEEV